MASIVLKSSGLTLVREESLVKRKGTHSKRRQDIRHEVSDETDNPFKGERPMCPFVVRPLCSKDFEVQHSEGP